MGLCDDTFFDALVGNAETRATYLNQAQAAELRTGTAFQTFVYGGITFVNSRGTDDNTTVAVPNGKCKFFPVSAPGVFKQAMSPGESFDWVNTPGQPFYALQIPDDDRNMFVDLEIYSYPLYVCT
ncbi:MAG: major capsid protein, partial [Eggerthellaceae bacterium]|nr:major capsid protein [Eggerthellaceae bacterium]